MAETKAEELSRLMYEIEGLNDSVTTNMALLGFELLPIGYFGKAKKAAQAPIATASRELAPRVQSQVAEDVSRLGNLESLEEFYLGQITGRKNKKKVMAQEISGAKSKSKASNSWIEIGRFLLNLSLTKFFLSWNRNYLADLKKRIMPVQKEDHQ